MLKICTVYFEGIYTPDYVSKLFEGIKSNTTVPFEFICLSDTDVKAILFYLIIIIVILNYIGIN